MLYGTNASFTIPTFTLSPQTRDDVGTRGAAAPGLAWGDRPPDLHPRRPGLSRPAGPRRLLLAPDRPRGRDPRRRHARPGHLDRAGPRGPPHPRLPEGGHLRPAHLARGAPSPAAAPRLRRRRPRRGRGPRARPRRDQGRGPTRPLLSRLPRLGGPPLLPRAARQHRPRLSPRDREGPRCRLHL